MAKEAEIRNRAAPMLHGLFDEPINTGTLIMMFPYTEKGKCPESEFAKRRPLDCLAISANELRDCVAAHSTGQNEPSVP